MNREPGGRPLRFFAMLAVGWVAIRLASQPLPADLAPRVIPALAARAIVPSSASVTPSSDRLAYRFPANSPQLTVGKENKAPDFAKTLHNARISAASAKPGNDGMIRGDAATGPVQPSPLPLALSPVHFPTADRWRGSSWILWRPDGHGSDIAQLGRLGGSQAGIRVDHDLIVAGHARLLSYARATAALVRPAAPETAIGLAIQPDLRIPVTFAFERRVALGDGGRNANAVMVAGGFGPAPVIKGMEATAYAQAGMVGFRRRDTFIDGKFSLLAPLAHHPIHLGAALSGGAQPGVHRVDIGPEAQVRLPLSHTSARLSVEWRERIAGRAAPASGLAITLAADF